MYIHATRGIYNYNNNYRDTNETLADYINGMQELFSGLDCSEPEKVTYFTEGLRPSLKVKVLERMPELKN